MGWERALITDSGGFQVFSLAHGGVADEVKGKGRPGGDHGSVVSIGEEGVRFSSYKDGTVAVHLARGLDGGAGEAGLRHCPGLRRVHALPRRSGVHGALDGADASLAGSLPGVARRAWAGAAGGLRDRPGRRPRGPAARVGAGGLRGGGRRDRDRGHAGPRQGGDARRAGADRAAAARGGARSTCSASATSTTCSPASPSASTSSTARSRPASPATAPPSSPTPRTASASTCASPAGRETATRSPTAAPAPPASTTTATTSATSPAPRS